MTDKREQPKYMAHYFFIGVVCFILFVLSLVGCDKAHAEEYDLQPYDENFYKYLIDTYGFPSDFNFSQYITDEITDTWNYVEIRNEGNILGFLYNDNRLDISNLSPVSSNSDYNELRYITWDGKQYMTSLPEISYTTLKCYLINKKVNSVGNGIYKINFTGQSYLYNGWSCTKYNISRTLLYNNFQSYESQTIYGVFNISNSLKFYNYRPTLGYCDTPYGFYTGISTGTKGTHIELEHMPDNNTDGFNVYKYGVEGSERLVADFSDLISISQAVGNSSTISINLTINNEEHVVDLDSSSQYYTYSVQRLQALYSIPYDVLGINSSTVKATLNSVTVINTTSSPGGSLSQSFYWLTPILLKGSDYDDVESQPISKENLPDYDKFDDPTVQTSYNETTNRWLTNYNTSFDYSLFTRWNFSPKYVFIGLHQHDASSAVILALKNILNGLHFGDAIQDLIDIGTWTVQEAIINYLNDNLYLTDLYDIIVFTYQVDENTTHYYIYTTDSYNNHLNNSLMYDLMQTIYDDGKAIETLYDYLYDRLNDFEDKSLTKFNEMVGLDEIRNDFITKIYNRLKEILDAILGLDLTVPDIDLTPIITRLDTVISKIDTGSGSTDFDSAEYKQYVDWLKYPKLDGNDNELNSPIMFARSAFDIFSSLFDSFKYSDDPDGESTGFTSYLDAIKTLIGITSETGDNIPNEFTGIVNTYYYSITDNGYIPGNWSGR